MSTPEQPTSQPQPSRDILVNRVESYTREEPTKALSAAFGIGILLTLLPVGAILTGITRLLFLIARPVLLVLGIVKVADTWDAYKSRESKPPAEDMDQPSI
jgi:hypothetical protein